MIANKDFLYNETLKFVFIKTLPIYFLIDLLIKSCSVINCKKKKMVFSVNQSSTFYRKSFSVLLILAFISSLCSVNQIDIWNFTSFSSVNSHLCWECVQEKLNQLTI